jgi:hypothetical protein
VLLGTGVRLGLVSMAFNLKKRFRCDFAIASRGTFFGDSSLQCKIEV